MSGGSYNYFCYRIEEFANDLRTNKDPLRIAFQKHLALVAKAAHDIEWVDSCDCLPGDEHAAILKVLGKSAPALMVESARDELAELKAEIEKIDAMLARNCAS